MRAHLARPVTLAALGGATALLALAGPFGTLGSLGAAGRFGYWGAVVAATYATGTAVDVLLRPRLPWRGAAAVTTTLALVTAAAVTAVVALLNLILLGGWPDTGSVPWTLATIFAVAAIATALFGLIGAPAAEPSLEISGTPAILDRLPLDKRGALVALSVEDHYVRVRTLKGEELLLMRLSDAIRETAPEPGLRVHRSHWVATAAVTAARRDGDRAILAMRSGGDIPVSRSHIRAVREAGLLPR
jgi:DNA-binding LytR/AlgR family response regulator